MNNARITLSRIPRGDVALQYTAHKGPLHTRTRPIAARWSAANRPALWPACGRHPPIGEQRRLNARHAHPKTGQTPGLAHKDTASHSMRRRPLIRYCAAAARHAAQRAPIRTHTHTGGSQRCPNSQAMHERNSPPVPLEVRPTIRNVTHDITGTACARRGLGSRAAPCSSGPRPQACARIPGD